VKLIVCGALANENAILTALVNEPDENVNTYDWLAAPVIAKSVNVAVPATAVTVVVPDNVPVPDVNAAVTDAVDDVRFPKSSRITTTGCVPSVCPEYLTPPAGCVVIARCLASPAVSTTVAVSVIDVPLIVPEIVTGESAIDDVPV
jgi:hypothetical protein